MSILPIVSEKWSNAKPQEDLFSLPTIAIKMFAAANWYWTNLILTVAQGQYTLVQKNCISFVIQTV